ncbi:hypothetical protein Tco_0491539 [Tanacetum coccineum]
MGYQRSEISTGFINGLLKKWLSFCQSIKNINHVKESELTSLFGKHKYEENLIDNIYEIEKSKSLVFATPLSTAFISASIVQDFQDSTDDEEDTRSIKSTRNDLEENTQAKLSPSSSLGKNKGLIAESYDWDEEEVSSDKNEVTEVKALMALADEERIYVGIESARNGEWTKISIKKGGRAGRERLLEMKIMMKE